MSCCFCPTKHHKAPLLNVKVSPRAKQYFDFIIMVLDSFLKKLLKQADTVSIFFIFLKKRYFACPRSQAQAIHAWLPKKIEIKIDNNR